MRIAVGGFCHETNSFGNTYVTVEDVKNITIAGEEMDRIHAQAHSFFGGFYAAARQWGATVVPTRGTVLLPSGPCTAQAFEYGRDALVEALVQANDRQPLDGIALFLHGGGAAMDHPDMEPEILRCIRQRLGDIPIALGMDLHANVSEEMVQLTNVITGNKHYPHIDNFQVAYDAFMCLAEMIAKKKTTYRRLIRLPWHMVPAQGVTTSGPAADIRELSQKLEEQDGELVNVTLFQGFPYADVARAGVTVVATAWSQEAADRNAQVVADYAWSRRKDMEIPLYCAKEAVELALHSEQKPVIIYESSDNPGGGTPGDGTHLLKQMLETNAVSAFGYISDPEVAELAAQAGEGAKITCLLGGKRDKLHGEPILLENVTVERVNREGITTRKNPMGKGARDNYGTIVCLRAGNVRIVVCGSRNQTYDDGCFCLTDVNWQKMDIVAVKSAQHFKGYFAPLVQTMIPCESPGIMTSNLELLPFQNADMTYYPLTDRQWK